MADKQQTEDVPEDASAERSGDVAADTADTAPAADTADTAHAADTADTADTVKARRQAARQERRVARLAQQIGSFARRHGGAEGQLAYVGQRGTRIVLVGADGRFGDLFADSTALARAAVEKAGITVHDSFDGEFAAQVRTGPYEWKRMAGIQLGGGAA